MQGGRARDAVMGQPMIHLILMDRVVGSRSEYAVDGPSARKVPSLHQSELQLGDVISLLGL